MRSIIWTDRAVDTNLSQRVLFDLKGRDVTQIGRACWLGPLVATRVPTLGVVPAEHPHVVIRIDSRPMAVVFSGATQSLELQCDARADALETDIGSLLGSLKLTW